MSQYNRHHNVQSNIRCSVCGDILDIFDIAGNYVIDKDMRYGSIFDGEHVRIRMCSNCMDKLIIQCCCNKG